MACGSGGGTNRVVDAAASTVVSSTTPKRDRDDDRDNNDDDWHVLQFGQVPVGAEKQAIETLVHDYFAAAVTASGRKACSLLAPFVAESVAESEGRSAALRGSTCAQVMTKLFELNHAELARKVPTLRVMRIGIQGTHSLVALDMPAIPIVHQVILRQVGGRWTMRSLLDGILE